MLKLCVEVEVACWCWSCVLMLKLCVDVEVVCWCRSCVLMLKLCVDVEVGDLQPPGLGLVSGGSGGGWSTRGASPTCRRSGGSGSLCKRPNINLRWQVGRVQGQHLNDWASSPDLPDVWRVGLVLQLLVRPAGCLAGRVCPATPCKTCRTSGGSGLSRAPCPTSGHPAGRAWSSSPTWSGGSGQGWQSYWQVDLQCNVIRNLTKCAAPLRDFLDFGSAAYVNFVNCMHWWPKRPPATNYRHACT